MRPTVSLCARYAAGWIPSASTAVDLVGTSLGPWTLDRALAGPPRLFDVHLDRGPVAVYVDAASADQVETAMGPIIDIGFAETRPVPDAAEVLRRRMAEG